MALLSWRVWQMQSVRGTLTAVIASVVFTVGWHVDQLVSVSTAVAGGGEIGFSFSQLQDRPLPRAALLPWGAPAPTLPEELPDFDKRGGGTLGPSNEDPYLAWRLATVIVQDRGGWGSGALVSPDGWLLTNYHVIENPSQKAALTGEAAQVEILLPHVVDGRVKPGRSVKARVFRVDPVHDLALVKLETLPQGVNALPFFRLAADVRQGEDCVVIGSQAGGLSWWARAGNVSAVFDFPDEMTDRVVGTASAGDLLERTNATVVITDTRISGGDSGGPLLNAKGELIGLTFATPANRVQGSVGWHIALKHVRSILMDFPALPDAVPFDIWTAGMPRATLSPPQMIDADKDGQAETVVMVHTAQVQDKKGGASTAVVAVSMYLDLSHRNEKRVGESVGLFERTPLGLWGRPNSGRFRFDLALTLLDDGRIVAGYTNQSGVVTDLRLGSQKEKGASLIWQLTDKGRWRVAQPSAIIPLLDPGKLSEKNRQRTAAIIDNVLADMFGEKEAKPVAAPTPQKDVVSPWPARTLMDGNWELLTPEESVGVLQKLENPIGELTSDERRLFRSITRLRALKLSCYESAYRVEGETRDSEGRAGVLSFLLHSQGISLLTGKSEVFREFNKWQTPQFRSADQAKVYVRLFTGALADKGESFRLIEQAETIMWNAGAARTQYSAVSQQIHPLIISVNGENWVGKGIVQFRNRLFDAELVLYTNGAVEMANDRPLSEDLPIKATRYSGLLRYDSF